MSIFPPLRTLLMLAFAAGIIGCGAAEEKVIYGVNDSVYLPKMLLNLQPADSLLPAIPDSVEKVEEEWEPDYVQDWNQFTAALRADYLGGVDSIMDFPGMNARDVFELATPQMIKDISQTPYVRLERTEWNGIEVKEYIFREKGLDEAGHEVDMKLHFYFEEREEGLRLIGFQTAG